jgi:hypothetical protein
MKVLSLRCAHGHGFEGWFGSEDDYRSQSERGLVECPLCGDAQIARLPTAPRISRSSARSGPRASPPDAGTASPSVAAAPAPERQGVEALWMQAVRHVLANTDDVGPRFPDEARRIHYGEVPQRGIRGQATPEQTEALREEGIEVQALPIPKALKEPLQ